MGLAPPGTPLLLEDVRDLWQWSVRPKAAAPGNWIEDVAERLDLDSIRAVL